MKTVSALCIFLLAFCSVNLSTAQSSQNRQDFRVVGYYSGITIPVDSFNTKQLTHLIYCFGGLNGNRLSLRSSKDSVIIKSMVAIKTSQPDLKVMLSLGGWGGCETCSDVFNTAGGRAEFAQSVKEMSDYFGTDGIDLDWEYPVVQGYPGHTRRPEDKDNFTALVKQLRNVCGKDFQISFAAGGYTAYIDSAIDWKAVTPVVDFINIMSYDLVHGYSTVSGHHTPLYSTPQQQESTDHAVKLLIGKNVPSGKLVIGAAFYGRFFRIDDGHPVGLYQPCRFDHAFSFKHASDSLSAMNGFELFRDSVAQAPYAINQKRRLLATYDDEISVARKTKYAMDHNLGGIMFWQLYDDKFSNGLLEVIYRNRNR